MAHAFWLLMPFRTFQRGAKLKQYVLGPRHAAVWISLAAVVSATGRTPMTPSLRFQDLQDGCLRCPWSRYLVPLHGREVSCNAL